MPRQPNNSGASHDVLLGNIQRPMVTPSTRSSSPGNASPSPAPSAYSRHSQSKPGSQGSGFLAFCNTFPLHIIYTIWAKITKREVVEEEKIAFYRGRRLAMVRGMIHWVPLAAAVVLITLNLMKYYIGGELAGTSGQDTSKLAALQFAAKLHELLMLASIGRATFAYIREEMTFGAGVTIGTVFAGQQFSSINNLWSTEFWSTIYAARAHSKDAKRKRWYNISTKWRMVWLIALATILGVSVGPSGAVLMRPRLEWWPAGGTDFWLNYTSETLFAGTIGRDAVPESCSHYTGDMSCPYGGFESLLEQNALLWPQTRAHSAPPQSLWLPGSKSLREMKVFMRSSQGNSGIMLSENITWAHGPSVGMADAIADLIPLWARAARVSKRKQRFRFREDASFSVDDHQPYVHTFCTPVMVRTESLQPEDGGLQFAKISNESMNIVWDNSFGMMSAYPENPVVKPGISVLSWLQDALFEDTASNSVMWLDDPASLDSTNSSLLAIVAIPQSPASVPLYLTCSIKTRLLPATTRGTRNNPASIRFTGRDEKLLDKDFPWKPYVTTRLSSGWAEYTNPYLPDHDMDVFALTSAAAGIISNESMAPSIREEDIPYAVESILTFMLLNGLSRLPYRAVIAGDTKTSWADDLMPKSGLGFGGQAYQIDPDARKLATKYTMKAR